VPDFRSDKRIRIHGTIGSVSTVKETVAPATADAPVISVFMSGGNVSRSSAFGLDDDLRLLVNRFIHDLRSSDRKTAHYGSSAGSASEDVRDDIQIALHGLHLTPQQAGELRDLMRKLVRERLGDEGADK
jgi:hypothetical protein